MGNMTKTVSFTAFGKTKEVEASLHNMTPEQEHERTLWVERPEDYYGLLSPQLKDKRVAIVTRDNWLRGKDIGKTND